MSDIVSNCTQTKLDGGLHFTEIAAIGLYYSTHNNAGTLSQCWHMSVCMQYTSCGLIYKTVHAYKVCFNRFLLESAVFM